MRYNNNMNNNENTQIIAHDQVLSLVQEADQLVESYQELTGDIASSAGIILSCLTIATDNIEGFASTRMVIDYRGYAIEFDSSLFSVAKVLEHIGTAMEVLRETMLEED